MFPKRVADYLEFYHWEQAAALEGVKWGDVILVGSEAEVTIHWRRRDLTAQFNRLLSTGNRVETANAVWIATADGDVLQTLRDRQVFAVLPDLRVFSPFAQIRGGCTEVTITGTRVAYVGSPNRPDPPLGGNDAFVRVVTAEDIGLGKGNGGPTGVLMRKHGMLFEHEILAEEFSNWRPSWAPLASLSQDLLRGRVLIEWPHGREDEGKVFLPFVIVGSTLFGDRLAIPETKD